MSSADITIHRAIIHKIDHHHNDMPQLSSLESPIEGDIAGFLMELISSNRNHKNARQASFDLPIENPVKSACDAILNNTSIKIFIQNSQLIAIHLFEAVKNDRRISPGDVLVCLFRDNLSNFPSIAILKVDPENGYVGIEENVGQEKRIVLKRIPDVMPQGELQKCAFVLHPFNQKQMQYDLIVGDQQLAPYGTNRFAASFCAILKCRIGLNAADKTKKFFYGSHEWLNKNAQAWKAEDVENFKGKVTAAVQNKILDVTEFAKQSMPTSEEQDNYLAFMREKKGLNEFVFEPDETQKVKLTQFVTFEGDNGLELKVNAEDIGDGKGLSVVRDDSTNTFIVTIRTVLWKQKTKKG